MEDLYLKGTAKRWSDRKNKEILQPLDHFLNDRNTQAWSRQKPEARDGKDSGTRDIIHGFIDTISKDLHEPE